MIQSFKLCRWNTSALGLSNPLWLSQPSLVLRERVIKPVLSGLGKCRIGRQPKHIHPIDQHYQALQRELRLTFETLGLAA